MPLYISRENEAGETEFEGLDRLEDDGNTSSRSDLVGLGRPNINTGEDDIEAPDAAGEIEYPEPLYDRVIARRVEQIEAPGSLIYIPETAKEAPQEGEVLSVGCGRIMESGQIIPLRVKVGDRVLFGKYAGTDIELSRTVKVLILREDEILAIVKKAQQ